MSYCLLIGKKINIEKQIFIVLQPFTQKGCFQQTFPIGLKKAGQPKPLLSS